MQNQKNIILCSESPRRKELLQLAGIDFVHQKINVEESYPSDLPTEEIAEYIAQKKAKAATTFLNKPEDIILTADSIVIFQHQIFEKPKSEDEAFRMLKALSSNWHSVITGVALWSFSKQVSFSCRSEVQFDEISDEEIHYYIDHFHPLDKAGAYGIQDWIGWAKIKRIEGLYSNIMGLPVQRVYQELKIF